MDGYVVRSADTTSGPLRLAGEVAAGETSTVTLEPGTAMGINTGAAIPPGADAVLQSELAEVANGSVRATEAIPVGQHIRWRGEDVHAGDLIAPAGEPLTLARVSSLAAAGVAEMTVHRRARLHILVTGSELLPLGAPPEPGKIHESNGLMVRLLAERAGARRDRPRRDRRRLRVHPRRRRDRPGRGRAGRLGRRLRRPARPRQAGASRPAASRRSSGACA